MRNTSINVDDYRVSLARMSRFSQIWITTVISIFVFGGQLVNTIETMAQAPEAIVEDRFDSDVDLDQSDAEDTYTPNVASLNGEFIGFIWIFGGDGFADVHYTFLNVAAFDNGEESLGGIFTVNEIPELDTGELLAFETRTPDIGPFDSQDFFIAWADNRDGESVFDINATIMAPSGEEFRTNDFAVNGPVRFEDTLALEPDAAVTEDWAAVVWTDNRDEDAAQGISFRDVYFRRFRNDGQAQDANDVRINTPLNDVDSEQPSIAIGDSGTMGVVWSDNRMLLQFPDGSSESQSNVYLRILPYDLIVPVLDDPSAEIAQLPSDIAEYEVTPDRSLLVHARAPRIAVGPQGTFLIVWHEEVDDGGDIYMSYINESGGFIDDQVRVDMALTEAARSVNPDAVLLTNGFYIITWEDDAFGGSIMARVWDPYSGQFLTGEFRIERPVDTPVAVPQTPRLAAGRAGDYITAWHAGDTGSRIARFTLQRFYQEGDLNNDGVLAGLDLLYFASAWTPASLTDTPLQRMADLNNDGYVNPQDLLRENALLTYHDPEVLEKRIATARIHRKTEMTSALVQPPRGKEAAQVKSVRGSNRTKATLRTSRPDSSIVKHTQREQTKISTLSDGRKRIWNNPGLVSVQNGEGGQGE